MRVGRCLCILHIVLWLQSQDMAKEKNSFVLKQVVIAMWMRDKDINGRKRKILSWNRKHPVKLCCSQKQQIIKTITSAFANSEISFWNLFYNYIFKILYFFWTQAKAIKDLLGWHLGAKKLYFSELGSVSYTNVVLCHHLVASIGVSSFTGWQGVATATHIASYAPPIVLLTCDWSPCAFVYDGRIRVAAGEGFTMESSHNLPGNIPSERIHISVWWNEILRDMCKVDRFISR